MKEIKITPPDGYEIDRENSTLDCIKFKPIKKLTYDNVVQELFEKKKKIVWINTFENIGSSKNGCTSEGQAKKLLAINQLMNVAKYLNSDWKPNWSDIGKAKYFIKLNNCFDKPQISEVYSVISGDIYFKSKELAEQALEILGEDTIRLALSTDW